VYLFVAAGIIFVFFLLTSVWISTDIRLHLVHHTSDTTQQLLSRWHWQYTRCCRT